jgi:hypothetical protein
MAFSQDEDGGSNHRPFSGRNAISANSSLVAAMPRWERDANNFPICLENDIRFLDRSGTKEACNMDTYAPRIERMMKRLYNSLAEDDRRRYAAIESTKLGHGGVEYISSVLQCDPKTIRRGLAELEETADLDTTRVRKKGVDAKI